jgi:hypothetical protein
MGQIRTGYRILVAKSEGKKPLGSARDRWKGNIKTGPKNIECEWIHPSQDREKGNETLVLQKWRNFVTS